MKRWCGQGDVFEDPTGDYVTYADAQLEIEDLQRKLDEVTRERNLYKAACALADALRNHERGLG